MIAQYVGMVFALCSITSALTAIGNCKDGKPIAVFSTIFALAYLSASVMLLK